MKSFAVVFETTVRQLKQQQQIPVRLFGDDNKKSECNGKGKGNGKEVIGGRIMGDDLHRGVSVLP
jgi:hypothetical protein